jgi:hypothetical protein
MAWPFEERRNTSRFAAARPAELQTPTGALHVEARDIGPGGAFVRSTTALAVGSKVQMTFTVPGPNGFLHDDFPFRYEGIVVRLVHLTDGDVGLALRWESFEEG